MAKRLPLLAIFLAISQSACVVVGGYTSRGGWFVWPGGLGLLVILALLYFILGRR